MDSSGNIEIQSVYAAQEEEVIVFRWDADAQSIDLISNDYTKRLDARVMALLTTMHSYPGFLAQITLDGLSKSTIA